MDAHLIDSKVFGHNWGTEESRAIFAERSRVARWVQVAKALANAQGELGVIPTEAAGAIAELDAAVLDLAEMGERTRSSSHSLLGLIDGLRQALTDNTPDSSAPKEGALKDRAFVDSDSEASALSGAPAQQYVLYGCTVQDVSDTAAVLELDAVATLMWRDLWHLEGHLLDLAQAHRATAMLGRTHAQPGAPISFGFKAASWADEVGRHLCRLREGRNRWRVGQLAGAVGVLGFHGELALDLQERFCAELGLHAPAITWTAARDRFAEFGAVAAQTAASLARIANEVYHLQREEIGELTEASAPGTVGSITMPHKRNPEASEQIMTLARLLRNDSSMLVETMVGDHERDGSTWKTEWVVFPQIGHYSLTQLSLALTLVTGLTVETKRMKANLHRFGVANSQELLARISTRIGKHQAQEALGRIYREAPSGAERDRLLAELATPEELEGVGDVQLGAAPAMVDRLVSAARQRRIEESDVWTSTT